MYSQARTWLCLRSYSSEKERSIAGPTGIPSLATNEVTLAAPAYTSIKSNLYANGRLGEQSAPRTPTRSCSSSNPQAFQKNLWRSLKAGITAFWPRCLPNDFGNIRADGHAADRSFVLRCISCEYPVMVYRSKIRQHQWVQNWGQHKLLCNESGQRDQFWVIRIKTP